MLKPCPADKVVGNVRDKGTRLLTSMSPSRFGELT
jgi:hypothetical protein